MVGTNFSKGIYSDLIKEYNEQFVDNTKLPLAFSNFFNSEDEKKHLYIWHLVNSYLELEVFKDSESFKFKRKLLSERISDYIAALARHVNGRSNATKGFLGIFGRNDDDEFGTPSSVRDAYISGEETWTSNFKFRNPLKEAAWFAVYCSIIPGLEQIVDFDTIVDIIPFENPGIVEKWNSYISAMKDVPEEIRDQFMMDEEGVAAFFKDPGNEAPVEEAHAEKKEEEAKEAADTSSEEKNTNKSSEAKAEKAEAKVETASKEDKKVSKETNPIPEHPSEGTLFGENNVLWEKNIHNLNRLTDIVRKKGLNISYEEVDKYPGLLFARIAGDDGVDKRYIMIDPSKVYGDTLRIIPCTGLEKDPNKFDIKKEMYLSLSDKELVSKAIDGTLTKEDRKQFFSKVPRVISEFRPNVTKYHFLDRIDLSGLSNGVYTRYPSWRSLICNISNIFKANDDQGNRCVSDSIRFRVADFESADKFKLICDDKVSLSFPSSICEEADHIEAKKMSLMIEYDKEKYKDLSVPFTAYALK